MKWENYWIKKNTMLPYNKLYFEKKIRKTIKKAGLFFTNKDRLESFKSQHLLDNQQVHFTLWKRSGLV